jgi:hypothetical protein
MMKVQINVFTESQVKFLEALLNDSGFENILSEDWNVADEYIPKNYIFADLSDEDSINWETFGYNINMILPGFMFRSEETDDETLIFTAYPTWAEGRELTREEYLSLFPEDYRKEMLEAEIENAEFNDLSQYKGDAITIDKLYDPSNTPEGYTADPDMAKLVKEMYEANLFNLSGTPLVRGSEYSLDDDKIRVVGITAYFDVSTENPHPFFRIVYDDCRSGTREVMTIKSPTSDPEIDSPIYQTDFAKIEG